MARRRKQDDAADERERGIGDNSIDPAIARAYVDKIEHLLDEIASAKGTYMQRAKTIRGEIATEYENARASGIPRKELRAVIKARGLERKADGIRSELEDDQIETFDQIRMALGDYADTPLGAAALERAESPEYRV